MQSYPTSEIFGWVGNPKGAPDILATPGWPDSPSPYTWAHISFDKGAGLNYFDCSDAATSAAIAKAQTTGADADFSAAAEDALKTGCWLNGVFIKRLHGRPALAQGGRTGAHRLGPERPADQLPVGLSRCAPSETRGVSSEPE